MSPQIGLPGLADPYEVVRRALRAGARPDPKLPVSEWADKHRILTTRSSPEPGEWRTARTPFLKDIMDSLSPTSHWERIVFMKGSQIGATECGNNWIGYVIHLAPGPMMVVQPTTDMAKRNSKQRIGPLIVDSPALRERVKEPRSRDSGNTILAKEFMGGILVMAGANSAKQLRSMAVRYLFLDEVDGYPENVDREGEPCDLAIARTTNFRRRKIFIASTPTIEGRSRIATFFEQSDQCYFHVPCPHCGGYINLLPDQLGWSRVLRHTGVYFCQNCEREIQDHHKNEMLPLGEWRSTAAGDGITRGYHLSSLYSPVGWLSFTQIMRKRDQAEGHSDKLQVFFNTILGLPFQVQGEVPDVDRLYERRELYPIGEVPRDGLILTAGADIQTNRIEVEIVAWGRDRQSWSVDYKLLDGPTNQPEVWNQLGALLDEDFPTAAGGVMRIMKLAVDSGFNTMRVYEFIRAMSSPRVMAIKGESHVNSLIGTPTLIEVGPGGRLIKGGVRLWPVNTSLAKEELYRWLKLSVPDLQAGENWPNGFCHFPQYSKEYFEQLCAEHLVTRVVMGTPRTHWERRRDRNEALDCRIYARAAAVSMRMDAWSEERWDGLAKQAALAQPAPSNVPWASRPAPAFRPMTAGESFLE